MGPAPRNILIVLLLAGAVYALPGGGTTAGIISALLGIAFAVGIWFLLMRMYREHKTTIYGLGDRHRLLLYGGLAAILFLGASASRFFESGVGTLVWLLIVGAMIYAFVQVFRQYRAYE
jgi:uncharacterized membrane protein YdcZ (DUF606 family)